MVNTPLMGYNIENGVTLQEIPEKSPWFQEKKEKDIFVENLEKGK